MSRPALPEERGHDERPPSGPAPLPREVCHVVETVDDSCDGHDGPPYERCTECGEARAPGRINPFGRCPARTAPTSVEERAKAAAGRDHELDEFAARVIA